MARFEEFLDLPAWTADDLDHFLELRHHERDNAEYKSGAWLVDDSGEAPKISKSRYNSLREYAAGISTAGGGLLFVGIPEAIRGQPDSPDGVPRSIWGDQSPVDVLGNVLWTGIYPRLYPPPKIHVIPLDDGSKDVIVIAFPPPLHRYYRVLHEGGFVPVRFADGLHRAPPGLEGALAGDRGTSAPAIELRPFSAQDIKEMPDPEWEKLAQIDGHRAQFPFVIANHGLGRLRDCQVGIVISYNECKQSEYRFISPCPQFREENPKAMPRPLRGFVDVDQPMVRVLRFDEDLLPSSDVELVVGVEVTTPIALRNVHVALWVAGEGIEPIIGAWQLYRISGSVQVPTAVEKMDGPPFRFGANQNRFV